MRNRSRLSFKYCMMGGPSLRLPSHCWETIWWFMLLLPQLLNWTNPPIGILGTTWCFVITAHLDQISRSIQGGHNQLICFWEINFTFPTLDSGCFKHNQMTFTDFCMVCEYDLISLCINWVPIEFVDFQVREKIQVYSRLSMWEKVTLQKIQPHKPSVLLLFVDFPLILLVWCDSHY